MKGKYAAKAVNRAAAVDNEVIVELRAKLESAEKRNRELDSEVASLKKSVAGSVMREAGKLAANEVAAITAELESRDAEYLQHLEQLAFDLLDLYAEHDCAVGPVGEVDRFNAEYARLFGMSDRLGELLDYMDRVRESQPHHDGKNYSERLSNRYTKRRTNTARKLRAVDAKLTDFSRSPGRFGVGVKPGQRLYFGRARGSKDQMEPPR